MSGEIELIIDEIEAIAKQMQGYIAGDAQSGASRFADATLDAGAFAGIPPGLEFFSQQQAAHQVFVETINGVVADLQQFGETLAANAASHRTVDESNAATLTAHDVQQDQAAATQAMDGVNQQYSDVSDGQGLAAEQAYDESREGNEALDVETEQDGGAHGQGHGAGGADAPQGLETPASPDSTTTAPGSGAEGSGDASTDSSFEE